MRLPLTYNRLDEARRVSVVSVVGVEKDFHSLGLLLVADFDGPIERVWQLWADSVRRMDALLAT